MAQQPENNIVRTAYEALAAVLGGTQSLHTNSMDEVLSLPTEKTVKIALRTQQIIAYETGVTNTVDPLAGSYFLEALTTTLEEEAEEYFQRIAELGGVVAGIEDGFFQREIADASYRYQKALEKKEHIMVGVNAFIDPPNPSDAVSVLKIDPAIEREQVRSLQDRKAHRNVDCVRQQLAQLTVACRTEDAPLMPVLLDCVRAEATLGEIVHTMKEVFGGWRERPVF
ncbi:MAG: hypothetical protein C7B46_14540 [Sulfobacillus benefaciens]|uniref:Methylmalonyl-CoA mutase alpha/beta chain catalytic domain-containing protein n=1 Tax=Sulfobacillus benefaciens TaxID=453960 RepID=A0A2T2XD31_9FIRM|nr:MAG: hypothetical protein C7B46_14540 [Sulfobacillus benefaciens]